MAELLDVAQKIRHTNISHMKCCQTKTMFMLQFHGLVDKATSLMSLILTLILKIK